MNDENYHTKKHIEAINKLEKLNEHEAHIRKIFNADNERIMKDLRERWEKGELLSDLQMLSLSQNMDKGRKS